MSDSKKDDINSGGPDITRRDFVGGALLGTGSMLLGMGSPAAIRTAAAQTPGLTMTGLGPEWTGPGGVGDYAKSNGNTAEIVNAAHGAIRNHERDSGIASAHHTGETYDLVVIGCGIAGLSAGYTRHKAWPGSSVLMLDLAPIFGGEAKQNEFDVDGYHLTAPQGSTGIVVPFTRAKDAGMWTHFTKELGFPDEFVFQKPTGLSKDILVPHDAWFPMHIGWEQSDTGFYYEGKGWSINPWRNGFNAAPLSDSTKLALMAMDSFRTPPVRDDWAQWLDSMTYEQFLKDVMGIPAEAGWHSPPCPYRRSTTAGYSDARAPITFEITHPFHPQRGTKFVLTTRKSNWGEDRVMYFDAQGKLRSMLASWTSVGNRDLFTQASAGRSWFRVDDLLKLCAQIAELKQRKRS